MSGESDDPSLIPGNAETSNTQEFKNPLEQDEAEIDAIVRDQYQGEEQQKPEAQARRKSARKSHMLTAVNKSSGNDESWEKRVAAHGPSSTTRNRKKKEKMALMFDLWDKLGDGYYDYCTVGVATAIVFH